LNQPAGIHAIMAGQWVRLRASRFSLRCLFQLVCLTTAMSLVGCTTPKNPFISNNEIVCVVASELLEGKYVYNFKVTQRTIRAVHDAGRLTIEPATVYGDVLETCSKEGRINTVLHVMILASEKGVVDLTEPELSQSFIELRVQLYKRAGTVRSFSFSSTSKIYLSPPPPHRLLGRRYRTEIRKLLLNERY